MPAHLYWEDSREKHGVGRRAIPEVDHLRPGGLCGGWDQGREPPRGGRAPPAPYASFTPPDDGASGGGYPQECGEAAMAAPPARRLFVDPTRAGNGGDVEERPGGVEWDVPVGQEPLRAERSHQGSDFGDQACSEESQARAPHARGQLETSFGRTRAPPGRGRVHIEPTDHHVTHEDHEGDARWEDPFGYGGRRHHVPHDHVKHQVMRPVEEIGVNQPPTGSSMKEAVRDWLMKNNLIVFDERKWQSDVVVKPRGTLWVIETESVQRRTMSREGPSAKAIADTFSLMAVADLRQFGVRFAGRGEIKRPEPKLVKGAPNEDNPTLVSPGMHGVLGKEHHGLQGRDDLSYGRKAPEHIQRRYIASGKGHFDNGYVPQDSAVGTHGHGRGDCFQNGLERGIGSGKRYIGTADNVHSLLAGGVPVGGPSAAGARQR